MKLFQLTFGLLFAVAFSFQSGISFGQADTVMHRAVIEAMRREDYHTTFALLSELRDTDKIIGPDKPYVNLLLTVSSMLNENGTYELGL